MKGEKTTAYLKNLLSEKQIPYLDVLVKKGHTELFRRYDSLDGKANGKEQLFFFSCTKPLTVACAMRLVEEGKLSLDDEVENYLPAYGDVFLYNGQGEKVPPNTKMTVRHLFTMSAGLTYDIWTPETLALKAQMEGAADTVAYASCFAKRPLSFQPGERFQYSLCHDVLAAVVEAASGKRFADYMQEVIFAPLGMKDTGFHTEKKVQMAPLYVAKEDGSIVETECVNNLVFGDNYDSGGAGAIGTVEDYAKFGETLACGGVAENGYRMLKKETVQEIRTETFASLNVNNRFTCVQGADYGYGLGVRTRVKPTEWGLPNGEFGWDGAAGLYLMVDPVHEISVVIGMHVMAWPIVFRNEHLRLVQCVYEDMQAEGLL
ncbi:MAG: beta-lactamase family protein [Clostridia bacterium]|nr:beta-lactamase family protein [Clostridia bacterium]